MLISGVRQVARRAIRLARTLRGDIKHYVALAALGPVDHAKQLGVLLGDDCRLIRPINFGSEPFLIEMGDDVTVSFDVTFITHDAATSLVKDNKGRRAHLGRIRIGSHVFIGARSTILPNVTIGDYVVVGAGSVVSRSIPDGSVVAGNPARYVCSFEEYRAKTLAYPALSEAVGNTHRDRCLSILTAHKRPDVAVPQTIAPEAFSKRVEAALE